MLEWIMLGAFLLAFGLSMWKIYHFFPNSPLADDDRTDEAEAELMQMMLSSIEGYCMEGKTPTDKELFLHMTHLPEFDHERFWRFNENRLRQLLEKYYLMNPGVNAIEGICLHLRKVVTETSDV